MLNRVAAFVAFSGWSMLLGWYISRSWASPYLSALAGSIEVFAIIWYIVAMDVNDKKLEQELNRQKEDMDPDEY